MTLWSVVAWLLALLDGKKLLRPWQTITVFGRVPMFFLCWHLYLDSCDGVLVALIFASAPTSGYLTGAFGLTNCRKGMGTICRHLCDVGTGVGAALISHARGTRE